MEGVRFRQSSADWQLGERKKTVRPDHDYFKKNQKGKKNKKDIIYLVRNETKNGIPY
jgi:hypothetical protein